MHDYEESNVNDLACHKWLAKFHARDLLLRLFHGQIVQLRFSN